MQMISLIKEFRFYSILVGASGAILLYWLHVNLGFSSRQYMVFWLRFCYPVFLLCSLLFAFADPRAPWRLPVLMMVSFYVGTLFLLPGAGELLLFEILLIAILTVPGIAVAYLGAYLRTRKD
jgi:hypothetical protein